MNRIMGTIVYGPEARAPSSLSRRLYPLLPLVLNVLSEACPTRRNALG
jgi:hypothetical protein